MAIAVRGGFQIPKTQQQQILALNPRTGNAGNGGNPGTGVIIPQYPGSFPRVNLNPVFRLGAYNNAEESYHFPRHNRYWKDYQNTNNPVKAAYTGKPAFGGTVGMAGDGSNEHSIGAGYGVKPWIHNAQAQAGVSSFKNSANLAGVTDLTWQLSHNINVGDPTEILPGSNPNPTMDDLFDTNGLKRGVKIKPEKMEY